jgi:tRNA modification GTPase
MSSEYSTDTITALSTPMGSGALSVIRISGSGAFAAVLPHFRSSKGEIPTLERFRKHKRLTGLISDEERIIDEVVLSLFFAPHSYTGEDVVEISCHCNPFIVREIIRLLLKRVRLAKPGEFTQRAFFNNRMDLTRAEAVGDLLNARTELSHRAALSQLEGNLYRKIAGILEELTSYRIELELEIDFVEQDLSELDVKKLRSKLEELAEKLQKLLQSGKEGMIIRDGLKVCLTGSPNVGKSSLFNHLLATDRAIVTPVPGTTRDYLEESLSLNGYLVRLYDTAGLRSAGEEVERIGISRTHDLLQQAARVIYIEDGEEKKEEYLLNNFLQNDERVIRILNKADILSQEKIDEYKERGFLICSVKTGEGIERLKEEVTGNLDLGKEAIDSGILSNMRQVEAVERSLKGIDNALVSLDKELGYEFTAFDLKVASEALEEVIGKITTDDILNRIFSEFCIGK